MRKRSCAVSYYALFQLECAGIKLIILSSLRDQLIMAAALDNPSMLENHDHIGIPNCGQSVCDNEYGSSVHQRIHTFLHNRLCSGIDRRCRLVHNHNRRICNCSTRNRNQLSLSLGQVRSVTVDYRLVSFGQTCDEIMRTRKPCSPDTLFICRIQLAIADIFHDSAGKEHRILQNNAKRTAQIRIFLSC